MLIGIDATRARRAQRTGTERYSLEIIRALLTLPEAHDHDWRLYLDQPTAPSFFTHDDLPEPAKFELCLLPARRLWTHIELAREVVRRRPDVLFVPSHVIPFVLPAWRLPPSVVTIHDLGYRHFPNAHSWRHRQYLEWGTQWSTLVAKSVIAVSQSTADDLRHIYATPAGKIVVIHEALPLAETATPNPLSEVKARYGISRSYMLYVGTIQPRKNVARLVQAFAEFAATGQVDCDLVLAGGQGWLYEPIPTLALRLGVADRVHFLGYVPDADLPALYEGALCFCFPSLFEGFGLPVLEAQHYGIPVMAANNSSLPEVAGDGALLVDPTNVEALADAMLRLTLDEPFRQQLIAAGYENLKRFSWEKAARETLAVLLAAARQGKPASE
jgi:glycosyltransferase involved in cell wall biosynthesis